jgi:hypothetical protein
MHLRNDANLFGCSCTYVQILIEFIAGVPDFASYNLPKWLKIYQMNTKDTKRQCNLTNNFKKYTNVHKIYQHFPFQGFPKCTKFGNFVLKIYHLATLAYQIARTFFTSDLFRLVLLSNWKTSFFEPFCAIFSMQSRVARWFVFKPKISILVNFGGCCDGRC